MSADYTKIHRLLRILTLIQGSDGWTARRLAAECGTTERTIYRDMRILEGAGIPYFYDPEANGYCIRRDFFLPPVQLTLDEALALAVLAEQVGAQEQIPFTRSAGRAITKIRSQLPASLRDELNRIDDAVAIRLAAAMPPEGVADVYETMRRAIAGGHVLECAYDSLSGNSDGQTFQFKPYSLLFNQRAWYVLGHHSGHGEVRCLKLNRFSSIRQTGKTFRRPKNFSVENHLGNAWRMIRGDKRYRVELYFDAEFAETIADTHWHRTQQVTWNDDGSINFACEVDGLDEIVWWVLSMGPHCRVLQPRELADRVRDLAKGMVELYEPPSARKPALTGSRQQAGV